MKRSSIMRCFLGLAAMLLFVGSLSGCSSGRPVVPEVLGIPHTGRYAVGAVANCPWDMAVYQGDLYVGGGNYGPNDGPVELWRLDTEAQEWSLSGCVPDEEINRFVTLGQALVAPGIDPREDWSMGNFYVLAEDEWRTLRVLPGVIHNFDVAEYEGMLFFGCGVPAGAYPVLCSMDGGQTYEQVAMVKEGEALSTTGYKTVRSYDLFVLNGQLYATLCCTGSQTLFELYRYEDGCFVYYDTWLDKLHQLSLVNDIVLAQQEFSGKMFFTTGYLYVTENMKDYVHVAFPENETVYDLWLDDGVLYALCGIARTDGGYEVSVWSNHRGGNTQFEPLFYFSYDVPPLSFVKLDGDFYIGMGDGKQINEGNGTILRVTPDKKW